MLEEREREAFLHAQLDQLPEKYRLVLTLRYLQHLSYHEIATVLNVPMGTVKTHIHRARRLLTERLDEWESGAACDRGCADVPAERATLCLQRG